MKNARIDRLHHQYALQDAPIDQWHSEERLILLLTRLQKVFVARMLADLLHRDRMDLLGDEPGQPLVERQPQSPDAFAAQPQRGGQHEIGAVGFQQIGGTDIGVETPCDQRDHVHQSLGGLAAFARKIADFLQSQNVIGGSCGCAHREFSLGLNGFLTERLRLPRTRRME